MSMVPPIDNGRPPAPVEPFTDVYRSGFQMGHSIGYSRGHRDGYEEKCDEITAMWAGVVPVWQQPRQAELERERVCDHTPCPSRCKRCSRCIHSMAYWARGGKDYAGAVS